MFAQIQVQVVDFSWRAVRNVEVAIDSSEDHDVLIICERARALKRKQTVTTIRERDEGCLFVFFEFFKKMRYKHTENKIKW